MPPTDRTRRRPLGAGPGASPRPRPPQLPARPDPGPVPEPGRDQAAADDPRESYGGPGAAVVGGDEAATAQPAAHEGPAAGDGGVGGEDRPGAEGSVVAERVPGEAPVVRADVGAEHGPASKGSRAARDAAPAATGPGLARGPAAGDGGPGGDDRSAVEGSVVAERVPGEAPVAPCVARGSWDRASRGPASPDEAPGADPGAGSPGADGRFTVRLANFEGPFDLLLQLIARHKLDVTEVALSKVTDEFMAYIRALGPDWDLDHATEFLVVAATLLDLKAARLLPAAEVEDEEDLALLEARDLLFARLLQYRAYKRIAAVFADRLENEARYHPRTVGLEPQHAELLPEVVLTIGLPRFAQLAVKAMRPRPKPQVYVDHIHTPLVSVREQAEMVIALLRERGAASFRELTADAPDTLTVVARFLALLELYREKAVEFDQAEALGTLLVRWTGGDTDPGQQLVTDEFDQEAGPDRREEPGEGPPPGGTEGGRRGARLGTGDGTGHGTAEDRT